MLIRKFGRILLAPQGDGGGQAGSGGGGGQGGLDQTTIDTINAAVTSAVKRLPLAQMTNEAVKAALPGIVEQTVSGLSAKLPELLKGAGGDQGGGDPGKGGKGKGGGDVPDAVDARFKAMDQQLEAMKAQLAEKDQALKAQQDATAIERENTTILKGLERHGVTGARAEAAVALMRSRGLIKRGEDGQATVEVQRSAAGHKYTETVALGEYVDEWAKTDEGKGFIPARPGVGGPGTGRGFAPGAVPGGGGGGQGGPRRHSSGVFLDQEGKIDKRATDEAIGQSLIQAFTGEIVDDAG